MFGHSINYPGVAILSHIMCKAETASNTGLPVIPGCRNIHLGSLQETMQSSIDIAHIHMDVHETKVSFDMPTL